MARFNWDMFDAIETELKGNFTPAKIGQIVNLLLPEDVKKKKMAAKAKKAAAKKSKKSKGKKKAPKKK